MRPVLAKAHPACVAGDFTQHLGLPFFGKMWFINCSCIVWLTVINLCTKQHSTHLQFHFEMLHYCVTVHVKALKSVKPQHDIDKDSAISAGVSTFTGRKSTTFSEVKKKLHLCH